MRRWIARISRIASSRRLASIADMARSLILVPTAPPGRVIEGLLPDGFWKRVPPLVRVRVFTPAVETA